MDVVITCLLNAVPDPQRGVHIGADVALIGELRASVHAHGQHLVVLHDCLDEPDDELTTFVRVPSGGNPYWHRWRQIAWHLLAHLEYDRVWCVDGTDVEMLHDPFPHMQRGTLYVGSEDAQLGTPPDGGTPTWLRGHCPSLAWWFHRHADWHVLNVGTVGGDRRDVFAIAATMAAYEYHGDDYEMGIFNRLAREVWGDRFVTGPTVHSTFLANDRRSTAWWRHK